MKYVALSLALIGVLPLALVLQNCPKIREWAWIALGFLPFLIPAIPQVDVALWGTPEWKGYVQGFEISLIDFLAIALLLSMPRRRSVLNYHAPLLLYLFALIIGVFQAAHVQEAIYVLFQFARMYLVVVAVTRGSMEEAVPLLILKGLALGIGLQFFVMIGQLRSGDYIQPPGTFSHQNTLGLVLHLVLLPHFALFLAGARGLQFLVLPPLGVLVAAMTASRASFGLCLAGLAFTYILSWMRRATKRKVAIAGLGLAGLLVVAPIAMSSFERRFSSAPLAENVYDERSAFNRAALSIIADHPFGVGPNHYVHVAKNFGYSLRAGVLPFEVNQNNLVHNAYLLIAVELGYIGLAALIFVLGYAMAVAMRYSAFAGRMRAGDLLLGIGAALAVVSTHSFYEYILFGKDVQYIMFVSIGIVFGVSTRLVGLSTTPRDVAGQYSTGVEINSGRAPG